MTAGNSEQTGVQIHINEAPLTVGFGEKVHVNFACTQLSTAQADLRKVERGGYVSGAADVQNLPSAAFVATHQDIIRCGQFGAFQ